MPVRFTRRRLSSRQRGQAYQPHNAGAGTSFAAPAASTGSARGTLRDLPNLGRSTTGAASFIPDGSAMASPELAAAIAKLLRDMPRNPTAIAIGEALKAEQANGPVAATPAPTVAVTECAGCKARREKQRAKMQRYRKKPKPK